MAFSLGARLRHTRQRLGLTQEQVIAELQNRYGVTLSQQALSCIENGKRKVDAQKELPALAAVYGMAIDAFYYAWELSHKTPTNSTDLCSDWENLTQKDKLRLAAELLDRVWPDL